MGFFDSFTGKSQRRDLQYAQTQANAALDQGYAQSQSRYDQAAGLFEPQATTGARAGTFYDDAIGLNGADARNTAQGVITSDPLWTGALAEDQNALMRMMNARGESGNGKAYLAGQRVLAQNYGNALDRYKTRADTGTQAVGTLAGIRTAQGDNAYGYGATKAGQATNYGNAISETRGVGVNNLMNMLGTGLKAYGAFRTGR